MNKQAVTGDNSEEHADKKLRLGYPLCAECLLLYQRVSPAVAVIGGRAFCIDHVPSIEPSFVRMWA